MAEKTLVSLVLIAYNQEQFIRESIISALSQTYSPLEIILSDDCSTDQTYEIMTAEVSNYCGRAKIILNRNQKNLGLAGNLNQAFDLSSGDFIVVQAGDDISVSNRVEKLVGRWQKESSPVDLVCSYFEEIDVNGNPTGFIKKEVTYFPDTSKHVLKWRCGSTGACAAYSRKLHDKYGHLDTRVYQEDQVYSFRAWIESGVAVVEEPLVKHRTHDASISVMGRKVKEERDAAQRRIRRRKGDENSLAIAEEWLRAWNLNGKNNNPNNIGSALQHLVKLKSLKFLAHDATRIEAFKIAIAILLNRGSIIDVAKLLIRHVLRWD